MFMDQLLQYIKLIRPYHWVKNSFVLAPVFFSGSILTSKGITALAGFLAFSLLSSCVYIYNDWKDQNGDRLHKKKKYRPIASGAVTGTECLVIVGILVICLIACVRYFDFSLSALSYLVIYILVNIAYSNGVKDIPILELLVLSSGFVVRMIFGASITDIPLSPWMLLCTALVSLMMAAGKRRGELVNTYNSQEARSVLNGYSHEFLNQINTIFTTATITAYMIFCTSVEIIMRYGLDLLLTVPFVFYGLLEYKRLLHVDNRGEDPTSLILGDKRILLAISGWCLCFIYIIYL